MVSVKYIFMINVSMPSSDFSRSVVMPFSDCVESVSLNHTTWVGNVRHSNQVLCYPFKAHKFVHEFKIIMSLIPFSQGLQGGCFHSGCRVTFGNIRKALNKHKSSNFCSNVTEQLRTEQDRLKHDCTDQ